MARKKSQNISFSQKLLELVSETNFIKFYHILSSDIPSKGRKSGRMAVKIDNQIFEGSMVRALFKKILRYLVDKGLLNKVPLPWGSGNTRYVITNEDEPKHPNGRDFFYPESYKGYTIETHYGRDRALSVLDALCKKLEIDYEPIDV